MNLYQQKQREFYIAATRMGHVQTALDALWRAASEASLLAPDEASYQHFTTARILALLDGLGCLPPLALAGGFVLVAPFG
jgi:hypothetical protein